MDLGSLIFTASCCTLSTSMQTLRSFSGFKLPKVRPAGGLTAFQGPLVTVIGQRTFFTEPLPSLLLNGAMG